MKRNLINAALVVFGFTTLALAQDKATPKRTAPASETSAITAYCNGLEAFANRHQGEARFFGDTAPYDESGVTLTAPTTVKWKEYKSAKARDAATTSDNLYNTADVWLRNGKVVLAHFQYGSPSGDWAQFVSYCFREDGSLAKIENSFRTFNGDIRIEQTRIFNNQGRLLRPTLRCYDLQSGTKKKCEGNYSVYDAQLFRTTRQLPIYALIKSRDTGK